jgi:phage-related protein
VADRTLTFTLLGRDLVSARLRSAGRSADDMAARVTAANAATSGSVASLVRDSGGRLRTLDGRFATAGEIAEAGLGGGTERGTRQARAGLNSLLPSLSGLGSMGGTVMKVVGPVGTLVATLGAAGPVVAALLSTLANLLPAAGLAATGIFMAVSAGAALKIGMSGVSEAISAAFNPATKAAKLQAALKGLAPNARAFVLTLREMKPQFDGLKLGVQNALFQGLGTTVRSLGASALPVLKAQLTSSASSLNAMAVGVANAAKNLATSGTLGAALTGANAGLRNLSGIPAHIVTGLTQVAAAAAPSFARLTGSAGSAVDKLSAKLSGAFNSGGMQQAIEGAITLFGSLFHIIGNVGTILSNVLAQAGGGAGAFGFLTTLTDTLAKVSAMPGVQAAFADLFTVMSEIGKVAGPLLGKALAVIAPVLVALAPAALRLVDSLGAGLEPIITALGPVLLAAAGAVASLADAVSPLLPVVGQMIASLGPILTPILKIVGTLFAALAPVLATLGAQLLPPLATVTKTLGTVFGQLSPVLTTALNQLGTQGLTPILTGLTTIISQMVTQYAAQFLAMFTQLLPVIPVLIPVVLQLAKSIGQILVAIAPLIPQIMLMGTQLISALLPALLPLLPPLAQLTVLLLKLATGVITTVVIPAISLITGAVRGMGSAMQPVIGAVTAVTKAIAGAFRWLYDVLLGHSIIPDIVNGTVSWFAGLPGKAATALAGLGKAIAGKASDAAADLLTAVRRGINDAVTSVKGMPGKAKTALGDLSGILSDAGGKLISGFISGITSKFDSVKSTLSTLTDMLPDWKGPSKRDAALLTPAGKLLIGGLIAGIDASTSTLKSKLGQVTTLIDKAISTNKTNSHKVSGLNALSHLVEKDNKKLQTLAAQRDTITARIAAAKKFASDTRSAALSTASLSNLDGTTSSSILAGLQGKLANIKHFTGLITDLAKKGLNKGLLQQVIQMGPDSGFEYASALDGASKKQLAAINSTAGQLVKSSTALGNVSADALYDSGKNAGRGFLTGLQSQQKAIENQMLTIAKGMQSAIRKALGIKSPSTVLAKDGGHATEGIAVGALARLPMLRAAMARVAATVSGTDLAFATPAQAPGLGVARSAQPAQVNITVQGAIDPVSTAKQIQKMLLTLKRTSGLNVSLEIG